MVRAKMITQGQATAAADQRLSFTGTATASGCTDFFCDYLQRWWDAQPQLGNLRTGGYSIVTTLDPAGW
jgi:membrane peptidoglycan carboxypeptidase